MLGTLPGAGTSVYINANGTYTSTVNGAWSARNIALGNTSVSGTQTLSLASASPVTCSNVTIGSRGVLSQGDQSDLTGIGLIKVENGALLLRRSFAQQGGYGDHDITVAPQGHWTWQTNTLVTIGLPSRMVTYEIDGALDGNGALLLNNNANQTWFTGTGTMTLASVNLNNYNGNFYLGGALTINAMINQSNAVISAVVLSNNASITLNGPYLVQQAGKVLLLFTNTASAIVTGTNLISIAHDDNGNDCIVTGTRMGAAGGTLTLAGSGALEIYQASTLPIKLQSAILNLQRNTRIWATSTAAAVRPDGPFALNFSGAGKTLTLDTNALFSLWNSNTTVTVNGGASLALRNGILEGGSSGALLCTNLVVGRDTAATLTLNGNSTNTFRKATESLSPLGILLGTNATVNAEAGSVLDLENCRLSISIQDSSAWGWKTAGAVAMGTGVVFEAMNTDRGMNIPQGAADRSLNELRLQAPGNVTLTLFNNGSTDNDGDSITDSALYVNMLELSGMSAGTTASVAAATGSGITTPRLYYRTTRNPNRIVLDGGILCSSPTGSIYLIR